MSTKVVIIALILALVLGAGAYFLLQPQKPKSKPGVVASGALVCPFDPALVDSIEVAAPGGQLRVERATAATGVDWMLVLHPGTGNQVGWPLEQGRVANLLRYLSSAKAMDTPDDKAEVGEKTTDVTLRMRGTPPITLKLSDKLLGGRGLIQVTQTEAGSKAGASGTPTTRLAVVEDKLLDVFRNPGPKGWRDMTAMPGMGPDVSRVRLEYQDQGMLLGRADAKWSLREPVAAAADPAQVAKLISTLTAVRIAEFFDEQPVQEKTAGLESPIARIIAETDKRVAAADTPSKPGDVSVQTATRELRLGIRKDAAPFTMYASAGKGRPVVAISGNGLSRELFDAVQYISKHAAQTPGADIGKLTIERHVEEVEAPPSTTPPSTTPSTNPSSTTPSTPGSTPPSTTPGSPAATPTPAPGSQPSASPTTPGPAGRVFRRDLDKWKEATGGTETTLDEAGAKAVADTLTFLTSQNATQVVISPPQVWREVGRVTIGSLGGAPLEVVTLGVSDGPNLVIRTGGAEAGSEKGGGGRGAVYRWYLREQVPALLDAYLPPAGVAPKPDGGTPPTPPEQIK